MPGSSTTDQDQARAQLERDGLLRRDGERLRTTRRWQGAMARAALQLRTTARDDDFDLRIPIVNALVEVYGPAHPDDELMRFVEVLLPIEAAEIAPVPSPVG